MWFQNVVNWLDTFFNKPLPVVGVSLIVILSFVWFIFKKTSFGKKAIKKATDVAAKCVVKADELKAEFDTKVAEIKDDCSKKLEAMQSFYETSLAQMQAKKDRTEELLLLVCDNIHNEKIKKAVLDYKKDIESHTTIMTVKLNEVKADFDNRLKALEEKLNEKTIDNKTTKE